jgi:hypothetical protein
MPEYKVQIWRKIPNTNTSWAPVTEVEFTATDDDEAITSVTDHIPPKQITNWRT